MGKQTGEQVTYIWSNIWTRRLHSILVKAEDVVKSFISLYVSSTVWMIIESLYTPTSFYSILL